MRKLFFFSLLFILIKSNYSQTPVFSEDFATLANKTPITTSNTSFTSVAIMSFGGIAARTPNNTSTTGSSMFFSRGNYDDGTNGVAVTGLPSSDVVSIYFVINSTTMIGSGHLFFGVGSGDTFTGTSTYAPSDLLFGGEFSGGTLNYATNDGTANIGSFSNNITYQIHVVANRSGSTVYYQDLSGNNNSVASGRVDIWSNGTLIGDDLGNKDDKSSTAFRMYQWGSSAYYEVDDIKIYNEAVNVLPVELSAFSAKVNLNEVNLQWQTATEVNNYGFDVERSSKPGQWQKIGFVAGAGNSNSIKTYSFVDKNPSGALSISYRLKQIDVSGKFKYYDPVSVTLSGSMTAKLMQNSPNPFNPSTSIKFYIPADSDIKIQIFDALGREVATLLNEHRNSGYHIVLWNGKNKAGLHAASGIYLCTLTAGRYMETRKMLLIK